MNAKTAKSGKTIRERFRMGKKGQMFLLIAVVIVIAIVVLRYNITYPLAAEEKKTLEARFENRMFNNLIEEFNNSLKFSYYNTTNMTKNVFDFANFSKSKVDEHSMLLKALFVGSVANRTTGNLNVSLINMLSTSVNANLTLGGTSFINSVENYGKWDVNFTITPGTQYTLQLTYDSTTEDIKIITKPTKDVYVGFFYISMETDNSLHRARYQSHIDIDLPLEEV
jgi:cell division protein FtsL